MTGPIGNLTGGTVYQVRHLERLPLGTPYPAVVAHVGRLLTRVPGAELAIDFGGVGRPVFDLFQYSGISPVGVLITSGTAEKREGQVISVPKLSLISRLQALLHEGRLKIHREIPEAPVLIRELQDFRVEVTGSGHLTFNARAGKHDDLALAIAIWVAAGGGMSNRGIYELYRDQAGPVGAPSRETEVIGLDLGQARDPTAICVVRRVETLPGIQEPPPEPLPEPEPAPELAPQPEPPPGLYLMRHRSDPNARPAGAEPGPDPGTWIVPGALAEGLLFHGFETLARVDDAAEAADG